jgi:ribokinase
MSDHIVVVGSLNMDLVVRAPRHPKVGETILGGEFRTYPGGKGANQAVAVARLGSRVHMVGKIGTDSFGDTLLETISENGVDVVHVRRDAGVPTGVAFITVDKEGQNTIVVASGANASLAPLDVSAAEEAFVGAGVLLLQLEIPLDVVERAISLARQHNVLVVLNPAPAQVLDADLLAEVDYLIPNQTELALLAGQDTTEAAIDVLLRHGVCGLVVTLGGDGALVVDEGERIHLPTYNVPVVDTTAAGDAFAAAFSVALTEGLPLIEATRWGNAAGAMTVMTAGAQPSLPYRADFDSFLQDRSPEA